jgi:hypothetical protein
VTDASSFDEVARVNDAARAVEDVLARHPETADEQIRLPYVTASNRYVRP